MKAVTVFYATLVYAQYDFLETSVLIELPDGCYIHVAKMHTPHWYRKDLSPVLIEDVPKEIKMLCLLMGIPLTP